MSAHRPPACRPRRLARLVAGLLLLGAAAPGGAAEAPAPEIARWELGGGADAYFAERPTLPIVDIQLVLDAGSARDGEHPGLAELVARTLDEGTAGLSAGELARRLEDTGARLSTAVGRDYARVHLRSLARPATLDEAVALLERVLEAPAFAGEAVRREREGQLQEIRAERQSAAAIAERALFRAMYGEHPYASPPLGTEAAVAELGPERVAAFYERYYVAANASVAVVGDIEPERARALAERLTGALAPGEPAAALPPAPERPARREVRIDFPAAQTALYMGQPAIARGEVALEYPLRVADQALGGAGMVSRLFRTMREERGLSYATGSRLHVLRAQGPWLVYSQVKAERAPEARRVLRGEIERLDAEGLDGQGVRKAVRQLTGAFPLALASNAALSRELASMAFYDLPTSHLARYTPRMEAVEPADVRQALAARLDPQRMATVVVGPDAEQPSEGTEAAAQ